MARYAEYADSDYLPGEVYSAGLSGYGLKPQEQTEYIAKKRFKFKPKEDSGEYFQQFLALQNNPQFLDSKPLALPLASLTLCRCLVGEAIINKKRHK
jgi:hypothetical protein